MVQVLLEVSVTFWYNYFSITLCNCMPSASLLAEAGSVASANDPANNKGYHTSTNSFCYNRSTESSRGVWGVVGHALDPLALSQSAAKLKAAAGAGKALQYRGQEDASSWHAAVQSQAPHRDNWGRCSSAQCCHRHNTVITEEDAAVTRPAICLV